MSRIWALLTCRGTALAFLCVCLWAQDELYMVESFHSDIPRLNIMRNTVYRVDFGEGTLVASQLSGKGLRLSPFCFKNFAYFLSFEQNAWRICKTAISDGLGREEIIVSDLPHIHQPRIVFDGAGRIYVSGRDGVKAYGLNGNSLDVFSDFTPFEFVAFGAALVGVDKKSKELQMLDLKTRTVKNIDILPIQSIDAPLLGAGEDGVLVGFSVNGLPPLSYKIINLVNSSIRTDPTQQTTFQDYRYSDGVTSFARLKVLQNILFAESKK